MPFKHRFGPASVILVVGFIVGVGLRLSIDDAAERDLANFVRSGLHGSTIPRFRAGLHCGPVIVSECGGFKRQLAYFGDTMNVSARLCEYCKVCGCNLIVSGEVLSRVTIPQNLQVSVGRSIALRGRNSLLEVHEAHQIADD